MSQYLILLYEDEAATARMSEAELGELLAAHGEFMAEAGDARLGGNALQPTSTATTIRSDGAGGFTVTDGPFAETKEALGGYYLVEAADLDAAIELAKQVPAPHGGVEVRPIRTFG